MRRVLFLLALTVPLLASAQHVVVGLRVGGPPPAVRVEPVPRAPSPRHVWVHGSWAWEGGRYVWQPGVWILPPGSGYVWIQPSWAFENGAWTYFPGHWKTSSTVDPDLAYQPAPPVEPDVATAPPPEPLQEVQPPPPFEGAFWIPGYWWWGSSRYVWVGGRWSARPRGWEWEQHRWLRRDDRHWERQPGHWHPH
jgi:YXWGXW repeat-containing protein